MKQFSICNPRSWLTTDHHAHALSMLRSANIILYQLIRLHFSTTKCINKLDGIPLPFLLEHHRNHTICWPVQIFQSVTSFWALPRQELHSVPASSDISECYKFLSSATTRAAFSSSIDIFADLSLLAHWERHYQTQLLFSCRCGL